MTPDQRLACAQAAVAVPRGDAQEEAVRHRLLRLLATDQPLIRGTAPDRPNPHLVCYGIFVHEAQVLLGHHRKSGLWLPPGGHVDPGETPGQTIAREMHEELSVRLGPVGDPLFLTAQTTVGPNPHVDITFWYVFPGHPDDALAWDPGEFLALAWWPWAALPQPKCEPALPRFLAKLDRSRTTVDLGGGAP